MAWIYLLIAGLLEVGWPVGLKISEAPERRILGIALAAVFMALSGFFLWLAQRGIPLGTAYAVWTGTGTVGTFLIGVFFYGDSASAARLASIVLIVAGIVGFKLSHHG
jgi:quaternary ammonium compound-resistance protein SugE